MKNYLFELKEGLIIAFRAIRSNKIRAALTTLGIVIGVTSVVLMATAIRGIDTSFKEGISSLGADVLYIDKWAWFSNEDWWKIRKRKNIRIEEYEEFKNLIKLPKAVAPTLWIINKVKRDDKNIENVFVTGTTSDYLSTTNFSFSAGRFFTDVESRGSRYTAVLGSEIAESLFPRESAIGREIKVGDVTYRVIGVLEKQGSFILGNFNPDKQVYVPIGTIFKHFISDRIRSITINVRAQNPDMVEATKEEATAVMRKVRGLEFGEENDFSVNQQEGLTTNYDQTVGVISIAGYFITGLSLFVGAIGIMNIMFVSVKERTKEIGIRKAIGAKRRTILAQFLIESSLICLLGGLIGLLLAVLLSQLMAQFLPTTIQVDIVMIAVGISLLTGIIAGFAPAYTASKLDPVEALRYE